MYNYYYMNYCYNKAKKSYPAIYHEVYPYVYDYCEKHDLEQNIDMNPFPSQKKIEKIVDNIYEACDKSCLFRYEEGEDEELTRNRRRYGRDIITILLIRELLDRRRYRPQRRRRRRRRRDYYDYY